MHIKNTGRRSIQMVYKNKNIRSYYSVIFWAFVVGAVLMSLTLLALFSGLISTIKTMKDVKPIDTVLQESGNRALNTVYFDITEAPVFLGAEKKSNYYLLTDGNKYRVAEIEDEEYEEIKSAVEASGSYHIVGMTHYIFKKNTRNEIVSEVEKLMGQNVITDCLDDERGIVCIEYMKLNYWNVFKSGWGLFGIIIGIIGFPIFYGSFNEIKASRKVISLSNITAKDIDEEANKDGSIWLNSLRIYITENMVLGIISDGNKHEGQVALRYNEIQRIYGYNKVPEGASPYKSGNYIIEAIATDGNKYTLSDTKLLFSAENAVAEREELFMQIKERNPNVQCEPENVKYKTYRFSYILVDNEAEYDEDDEENDDENDDENDVALTEKIKDDDKPDIIMDFNQTNLPMSFKPADAIVSMNMSFPEDGIVEITTGYFGDRENEVEPKLYEFLKGQLMDGWGEGYEYYDYVISFKELG